MTARFDAEAFRRTAPNQVSIYLNSLGEELEWAKPTRADLEMLLKELFDLSEVHSIYLAHWAIEAGTPLPADTVVELLRRCQDRGGQFTLTQVLSESKDLAQRHIEEVEELHASSPHFILAGGLAELKEKWSRRTGAS